MAYIRVDMSRTVKTGSNVSFKAPCDCHAVDGLKVYFPNASGIATNQTFIFTDAHGNNLTGIGNLFKSGAVVKAILNLDEGRAYLQNADTNAYLEEKFANLQLTEEAKEEIIDAAVAAVEAKPIVTSLDFTNWETGAFSVGLSDGTTEEGAVVFDDSSRPVSITLSGKTLEITYPVESDSGDESGDDSGDDSGTTETITFTVAYSGSGGTITSTECTAESGMTWGEWCESAYNTGGFSINTNGYVVAMSGLGFTSPQMEAAVIVAGKTYTVESAGSDMG